MEKIEERSGVKVVEGGRREMANEEEEERERGVEPPKRI